MVDLKMQGGRIVSVSVGGEPLSIVKVIEDGEQINPNMGNARVDSRPSRLVIERDGIESIVHCARVGDRWWIHLDGYVHVVDVIEPGAANASDAEGAFTAPMPGKVLDVLVPEGAKVREGQDLMVLEAMKMEHRIAADRDGTVASIYFQTGDQVDAGSVLLDFVEDE